MLYACEVYILVLAAVAKKVSDFLSKKCKRRTKPEKIEKNEGEFPTIDHSPSTITNLRIVSVTFVN